MIVFFSVVFAVSVPVIFLLVVRKFNGYLKNQLVDLDGVAKTSSEPPLQTQSLWRRVTSVFHRLIKDNKLYEINFWTLLAGVIAYLIAAQINPALVNSGEFTREQVIRIVGPLLEEILKALFLIYLVRQYDFPVSVGVLYGFGVGIGFAAIENIEYILPRANIAFTVAYSRVFSTNLVHAACSGLLGAALAYLKFYRAPRDYFFSILIMSLGVGLHMFFNTIVSEGTYLIIALAVGAFGGGLITSIIRLANKRHGGYASEIINIGTARASHNEAFIVKSEDDLRKVFREVEVKFSTHHATLVDDFLKTQVEIITKRKILEVTKNPKDIQRLEKDIEALVDQTNKVRNKLGWDCMVFVRTRYTLDEKLWSNIEDRVAKARTGQKGGGVWDAMSTRIKQSKSEEDKNP